MSSYSEKLRDPRWQRRRLEIMQLAHFQCESCAANNRTLNVHHVEYRAGADPWEYGDGDLECLCELCHESKHFAISMFKQLSRFSNPTRLVAILAGWLAEEGTIPMDLAGKVASGDENGLRIGAGAHYPRHESTNVSEAFP